MWADTVFQGKESHMLTYMESENSPHFQLKLLGYYRKNKSELASISSHLLLWIYQVSPGFKALPVFVQGHKANHTHPPPGI